MLSALGLNKVKVTRKVIVGLLSNGNELINPGKKKKIIKFMTVTDTPFFLY